MVESVNLTNNKNRLQNKSKLYFRPSINNCNKLACRIPFALQFYIYITSVYLYGTKETLNLLSNNLSVSADN